MAILFASATLKEFELYGGTGARSRTAAPLQGLPEYYETDTYNDGFSLKLDETHDELYLGLQVWLGTTTSTGSPRLFKLMNTTMTQELLRVQATSSNTVVLQVFNGTTFVNGPAIPVTQGNQRWDIYFKRDATNGRVVVKINNEVALDYTGNTDLSGKAWGGIAFGSTTSGSITFYMTIVATEPTDKLRMVQLNYTTEDTMEWTGTVTNINGNSTGSSSTITSLDGTSIDVTEVDKDAIFNVSAFLPAFENSKIKAVVIGARASTEAPVNKIQGVAKVGGTVYARDPSKNAQNVLAGCQTVFETNPATGLPWTPAEIMASSFGYRSKG